MTSPSKHATMFIMDKSPSMNCRFPSQSPNSTLSSTSSATTRLSIAKTAILERMLYESMLQSKMNEAGVVVFPTNNKTSNHLCCPEQIQDGSAPFPHITELGYENNDGSRGMPLAPITIDLFKQLRHEVKVEEKPQKSGLPQVDKSGMKGRAINDEDEVVTTDFIGGLIVAADAMYQRTKGKRYQRQIVMITDAQTKICFQLDDDRFMNMVRRVVLGLKELDCPLIVIGIDFQNSLEISETEENNKGFQSVNAFATSAAIVTSNDHNENDEEKIENVRDSSSMKQKLEKMKNRTVSNHKTKPPNLKIDVSQNEVQVYQHIQSENQKLLQSLVKLIGGAIHTISSISQIPNCIYETIASKVNNRKSTKKKIRFTIAPGLEIDARFGLLISKVNLHSLKSEYFLDQLPLPNTHQYEQERYKKDQSHEANKSERNKNSCTNINLTSDLERVVTHWDADNPEKEVDILNRTTAYRFGSDLIPLDLWDIEGLKIRSPVSLVILYYVSKKNIPKSLFLGSPYELVGEPCSFDCDNSRRNGSSSRSCVAIAGLAQAMEKLGRAAICRFVKSKDADPLLAALFPLSCFHSTSMLSLAVEKSSRPTQSLFLVQLPFSDDFSNLTMPSFPFFEGEMKKHIPFKKDNDKHDSIAGLDAPEIKSTHPKEQKTNICNNLIDALMLPNSFRTDRLCNPTLECLNQNLFERAIDSNHIIDASNLDDKNEKMRSYFNINSPHILYASDKSTFSCNNLESSKDIASKKGNPTWDNQYSHEFFDMTAVRQTCELFRTIFPLEKMEEAQEFYKQERYNKKGKKRYWGDI